MDESVAMARYGAGEKEPSLIELAICAYAWLALLGVDLALRAGARIRVDGGSSEGLEEGPAAAAAGRLARWVGAAARRHLYPIRCLPRALVLRHLLRVHGIPATLRIGVRRVADRLEAHAWIEHHGSPLGEGSRVEERFRPLMAWSSTAHSSARDMDLGIFRKMAPGSP